MTEVADEYSQQDPLYDRFVVFRGRHDLFDADPGGSEMTDPQRINQQIESVGPLSPLQPALLVLARAETARMATDLAVANAEIRRLRKILDNVELNALGKAEKAARKDGDPE